VTIYAKYLSIQPLENANVNSISTLSTTAKDSLILELTAFDGPVSQSVTAKVLAYQLELAAA
jgi:hypothetical protein